MILKIKGSYPLRITASLRLNIIV